MNKKEKEKERFVASQVTIVSTNKDFERYKKTLQRMKERGDFDVGGNNKSQNRNNRGKK
jgi:hypothetical protein